MKCKPSYRDINKIATKYSNLLKTDISSDEIINKLGELISPDYLFDYDSLENIVADFNNIINMVVVSYSSIKIPSDLPKSKQDIIRQKRNFNKKVQNVLGDQVEKFVEKYYNLNNNIDNTTIFESTEAQGTIIIEGENDSNKIILNDNNDISDIEQDYSEEIEYTLKLSESNIRNYYKGAESVMISMSNEFKRSIIGASFINLNDGTITKNDLDLNKNINDYKNKLFNDIIIYLNNIGGQEVYTPIYNNGVSVDTSFLDSVLNKMPDIFKDVTENKLMRAFNNKNNSFEQSFIKAYNAYIILNNFDDMIYDVANKFIKIDNRLLNVNEYNDNKYFLHSENSLIETWRTEENISAIDEVGSLPKLLISLTPMKSYEGDNLGTYMNFNEFAQTFAKLKIEHISQLFPSNGPKLMRIDPYRYMRDTLEFIINPKYKNTFEHLFNKSELNVFRSIYDMFFYPGNPKEGEQFSVYRTLVKEQDLYGPIFQTNVFEVILNTMANIEKAVYNQYAKDFETNNIIMRNILDSTDNKFKNDIESDLDVRIGTLSIDNRLSLKDQYSTNIGDYKTQSFLKFKIPGIEGEFGYDLFNILTFNGEKLIPNQLFTSIESDNFREDYAKPISEKEKNTFRMLEFLDDIMGFRITSNDENFLYNYIDLTKNPNNYMLGLMNVAAQALWNNELYITSEESGENIRNMFNNSNKLKVSKFTDSSKYFTKQNDILKAFSDNVQILTNLAKTQALINNDVYKNNTLNLSGDSTPTTRITNQIRNTHLQFGLERRYENPDSTMKNNLMYLNEHILKDVVITADGQDRFKENNKKSSKFNIGEILYTHIVFDFLQNMAKNGEFLSTPTVYSDKSSHYKLHIDANKKIVNIIDPYGNIIPEKELKNMNSYELNRIIYSTMYSLYDNLKNNLVEDYKIIIKNYSDESIKSINVDNLTWEKVKQIVPTMTPKGINDAADLARSKGLDVNIISEVHYSQYGKKEDPVTKKTFPVIGVNGTIDYNIRMYSLKEGSTEFTSNSFSDLYKQRVVRGKRKLIKTLMDNYPNFYITNLDDSPILAMSDILENQSEEYKSQWINKNNNTLIIAKYNGVEITKDTYLDILTDKNIRDTSVDIKLNPLFEKYFDYNQLIGTNYTSAIVGHAYNHPAKGNINPTAEDIRNGITKEELEESARQLAQYKRMVILPATLNTFIQNSINGITQKYNIAVVEDLTGPVYNYSYDKKNQDQSQDVHDGSAFSNPIINVLENNSLLDQKVGEDVKSIGSSYNSRYGTASLYKWAVFALYNERMRMSNGSNIKLKNLFKKMNNIKWDIPILNIMSDFDGNIKSLSEKLGERVFYKSKGKFYEVLDIINNGDNSYSISKIRVDKSGNSIGESYQSNSIIDTNYKLWEELGGENSMTLNSSNDLEYSDASIKNIAKIINSVGIYRTQENADKYGNDFGILEYGDYKNSVDDIKLSILDQTSVYQPMKHSMTAYMINKSGMKNGSSNINGVESYYDYKPLKTMRIDTHNLGIQMDADHDSNMSQVTEMSQVISAIEEKGRTHKIADRAYSDLGKLVYTSVKDLLDAMEVYYKIGDKSEYYKIVGKSLIKTIQGGDKSLGLAEEVIKKIQDTIMNSEISHIKIPFSDSSLMSLAISNLASFLNRSSIKRKYSGIASVLVPSYDMYQLYNLESFDKDSKIYTNKRVLWENIPELTYSEMIVPKSYVNDEDIISNWENKSWINQKENEDGSITRGLDLYSFDNIEDFKGFINNYYYMKSLNPIYDNETIADYDQRIYDNIEAERKLGYIRQLESTHPFLDNSDIEIQSTYDVFDSERNLLESNKLINTIEDYNNYRKHNGYFKKKITAENLKPSNITFKLGESKFNMFDLPSFQNLYNSSDLNKSEKLKAVHNIQEQLDNLKKGYVEIPTNMIGDLTNPKYAELEFSSDGEVFKTITNYMGTEEIPKYVKINNLNISSAELILSKIYKTQFDLRTGDNINEIRSKGSDFFYNRMMEKIGNKTTKYDISFKRGNGNHVYVMFKSPETEKLTNKNINTINEGDNSFRIDELGNKIYSLNGIEIKSLNESGVPIEIVVVDSINSLYNLYQSENFDGIEFNKNTKEHDNIIKFINNDNANTLVLNIKELFNEEFDLYQNNKDALDQTINRSNKLLKDIYRISSKKKYTSFIKSLDFVAARIPSQSMQSFMPMTISEFTDSEKNIAYVSHWQLWLQGSDYDIDKVYLMGSELDKNGHYIGWNNLFDISSIKKLKESENLPIPNGKTYTMSNIESENTFNITTDLINLINDGTRPLNKWGKGINDLSSFGEFLYNIDEYENLYYDYDNIKKNIDSNISDEDLTKILNNFESVINYSNIPLKDNSKVMLGMKNSVSSKIYNIIIDISNQISAFSPVEMDEPRKASQTSNSGKEARTMTADNPGTNAILQFENMSGKEVIGIAAVGLKIFFALSNYYNNHINDSNIENLVFDNFFDLKGKKIRKNILSNVNYGNKYNEVANNIIEQINTGKDVEDAIENVLEQLAPEQQDTSIIISSLLSAATDNAKELILAKINAGSDLAGVYMYLMMLGVDFQDISDFMKSDTINLINKLSKNSMFDETQYGVSLDNTINKIIRISKEGTRVWGSKALVEYLKKIDLTSKEFNYDKFYFPKSFFNSKNNQLIAELDMNKDEILYKLQGLSTPKTEIDSEFSIEENNDRTVPINYMLSYIYDRFVEDKNNVLFQDLLNKLPEYRIKLYRLFEDRYNIDSMIAKMNISEVEEFKKLQDLSNEITILGRILAINQGMSTNISGLYNYGQNVEQLVYDREKIMIKSSSLDGNKNKFENLINGIENTKPYLKNVEDIILNQSEDIAFGKFRFNKFINDENYRQRSINYYNLIKGTYNVLDVIDKVKHFKAMIKVQNIGSESTKIVSERYKYLVETAKENISASYFADSDGYPSKLNEKQINTISDYFNDVIIVKWLDQTNLKLNLEKGNKMFDRNGKLFTLETDLSIRLNNESNLATYKNWFENVVYSNLKKGIVDQGLKEDIKSNRFLKDLTIAMRTDYVFGGMYPFIKPKLNMSNIESEYDKSKFDEYKTDFKLLSKYTVGGIPLSEAFFIYNLLLNKNKYGSDSLSRVFDSNIEDGSIINDYFTKVGKMDWDEDITDFDYNLEDLYFRLAPNEKDLGFSKKYPLYTKSLDKDTNKFVFYKNRTRLNISNEYSSYFMIKNPSNSMNVTVDSTLNKEEFINTMKRLIANNQLQIQIDCE